MTCFSGLINLMVAQLERSIGCLLIEQPAWHSLKSFEQVANNEQETILAFGML